MNRIVSFAGMNPMKISFLSCLVLLMLIADKANAQPVTYEKGYFRYPLDIEPRLNANFGEMRPNHFHMGLDLFTLRRENLPVYAAAEGYVSRVKIEAGGFGNAIYIDHPNGTTTLYAHMNGFFGPLASYIRGQQYQMKSWSLDVVVPKGLFPLKKGDFIGPSGNTGASQGPHVHFEIRETTSEKCLNPLLFGFRIPDAVPPQLHRLAIYDRRKSVYEQQPVLVPVTRISTGHYKASVPKLSADRILIAVQATDQMTGVPNQNGIYRTVLRVNGEVSGGFTLDAIGYDETRFLNAHIDHRYRSAGGPYLQFLNPLEGDRLPVYAASTGGIDLPADKVFSCSLEVLDADGNRSVVDFSLEQSGLVAPMDALEKNMMRPGEENIFETDDIEVYIPKGMLYDSIRFRYQKMNTSLTGNFSSVHQVHDPQVPVHGGMMIRIRPEKVIPYPLRERILIRQVTKSRVTVRKANWSVDKFGAIFRDFGSFELIADSIPPVISGPVNGMRVSAASRITVFVQDNNKQLKNFRGELDGQWILFEQRGNSFVYRVDEKCPPGEHQLKIYVEDEAGNQSAREYKIVR